MHIHHMYENFNASISMIAAKRSGYRTCNTIKLPSLASVQQYHQLLPVSGVSADDVS